MKHTQKELENLINRQKKLEEAKNFLASTDYKMTTDYDQDVTKVTVLRVEAREYIRTNTEK